MKLIKFFLFLFFILILFASPVFAQLYITEPIIQPLSLRSVSMGGAYIGIANDDYVLFHNPAGLGLYEGFSIPLVSVGAYIGDISSPFITDQLLTDENGDKISIMDFTAIMENLVNLLPDLEDTASIGEFAKDVMDTKLSINAVPSVNIGFITKHFGIRTYDYTSINLQFNRVGFLTEVDILAYADAGLIGGFGFKLADWVYVGANLKYVKRIMIAKDNIGLSTLLQFIPDSGEDTINSLLHAFNRMGIVKTGWGIGSDIGFMFVFKDFQFGVTITDWWGGTTISYFQSNVFRPLEPKETEEGLKGVIPTAINIGVAYSVDKLGVIPEWIISDFTVALDIRELFVFKFNDGEPSFDKTFFRNIYMGLEVRFFDVPGLRNIILLPLRVSAGFYQGNISFGVMGTLLWFFDIGIAVWGEERSDRIGQSRVYNFAFLIEIGF